MTRPSRKTGKPAGDSNAAADDGERLQKVLAAAGHGSRRLCEELIRDGRVEVDGQVVTELGTRVDRAHNEIRVDGIALHRPRMLHYMLNKPTGIVCTSHDPSGRPRVIDLVPQHERLFTVGRLDLSSEGLILVTNDGELANRLTHPRYGIEKTYHVEVAGRLEPEELQPLRKGAHLAEGFVRPVIVRIRTTHKKSTLLEIVLDEGRNREIRRLLAKLGHKVLRLKRIALGPLRLGELPSGHFRELARDEIRALRNAAPHEPGTRASRAGRKPRTSKPGQPRTPLVKRSDAPPIRKPHEAVARAKTTPPAPPRPVVQPTEILVRPGPRAGATQQGSVIGADLSASPSEKPSEKKSAKAPRRVARPAFAKAGRQKPATSRPQRGKHRPAAGKRGRV